MEPPDPQGPETGADGGRPRSLSFVAVLGALLLVGLIGFAVYRRGGSAAGDPDAAGAEADATVPGDDAAGAGSAAEGTPITAVAVPLTPEAKVAVERYRCICGCNDALSVCTCTLTPGSIDMKNYVQELATQKKSPAEIDAAMVGRYGEAVLLSNAPAAAGDANRRKP